LDAAEVTFCGLDGDVTKQELNPLQLAPGGSAKPGAASAQIVRGELSYAALASKLFVDT